MISPLLLLLNQSQLNIFFCVIILTSLLYQKKISHILSFAGIEPDSCLMEAHLPLEKIQKGLGITWDFVKRKKATYWEVQSLTGLLNFACSVIVPGLALLCRLINLTTGMHSPNFSTHLTRVQFGFPFYLNTIIVNPYFFWKSETIPTSSVFIPTLLAL